MIEAEVGVFGDVDVLVEVDIEGLVHDETEVAVLFLLVVELLHDAKLRLSKEGNTGCLTRRSILS